MSNRAQYADRVFRFMVVLAVLSSSVGFDLRPARASSGAASDEPVVAPARESSPASFGPLPLPTATPGIYLPVAPALKSAGTPVPAGSFSNDTLPKPVASPSPAPQVNTGLVRPSAASAVSKANATSKSNRDDQSSPGSIVLARDGWVYAASFYRDPLALWEGSFGLSSPVSQEIYSNYDESVVPPGPASIREVGAYSATTELVFYINTWGGGLRYSNVLSHAQVLEQSVDRWLIKFEDGGDQLYNDVWITILVTPERLTDCDCPLTRVCPATCGGPIDTFTGAYTYDVNDLTLPALGQSLSFKRTYVSKARDLYTATLGYGWTHAYDQRLLFPGDPGGQTGRLILRRPGGALIPFTDNGDGTFAPEAGVLATLGRAGAPGNYTYAMTTTNQATYLFDNAGRIVSQNDSAGRPISYTYFITGPLQTVADATGLRYLRLSYDALNRLTAVTDSGGRVARYGYDSSGDLAVVTDTRGLAWTYSYSGVTHLLTQITDPDGRIVEQTSFDSRGRAVMQTFGQGNQVQLGYPVTGTTVITDARSFQKTDWYNSAKVLISQTLPSGSAQFRVYDANLNVGGTADANKNPSWQVWSDNGYNLTSTRDALGNETLMSYDALNNLTQTVDASGLTTTFTYSGTLLTSRTDALGHTWVYTYNANGLMTAEQDPAGHVSQYEYDSFGQRTAVTDTLGNATRYEYDNLGRLITTANTLGQVTVNQYDPAGHLLQVTRNYRAGQPQNWNNEYNLVTQYAYDGVGRQTWITDTLGRVTRNEYDPAGRLVTVTQNYLPGQPPNYLNQYNLVSLTGYDTAGNVVTQTEPSTGSGQAGRMTVTQYDSLNRPVTVTTNYVDGVFDPTRPDEDVATVTGYDAAGNVITQADALGRVTRTWYDSLNRTLSVTANYSPTLPQNYLNEYNLVTQYEYDEVGNRIKETDTLGRVNRTEYDALNRPYRVTQNYWAGQSQNYLDQYNLVTTYGYDDLGNRTAVTDTLNHVSRSEYDDLNRLSKTQDAGGNWTEYAYDRVGNRTVMTDALSHVTRFDYDSLGRVVTTTQFLGGTPINSVVQYDALGNRTQISNAQAQISRFGYDALGRNVVIIDAKTHTTTITYDVLGQRVAQTDGLGHTSVFTYDLAGRQVATADPLGNVTRYGYDVLGNRVVMTDANGIVTRYEYDTLNRLLAVVENTTGGPQTSDRDVRTEYSYDVFGNRVQISNAQSQISTFAYDSLSRLISSSDPLSNTTGYQYDALGSRTVMTDANGKVTSYAYDALNRPTSVAYTADAKTVSYAYDKVGNRTVMTDSAGVTRYTYDDLYRLTNVADPYSQIITYTYDAVGNRTNLVYPDPSAPSAGQAGKVVTYTYDAVNLMSGVVDWSGGTTAYLYDDANRLVTATLPNGVRTVYTYDDANRLTRLNHSRNGRSETLGDYAFALDKVGNRLVVTETLMYPSSGGGQAKALPPTKASEVAMSVTGQRAASPIGGRVAGLSAPLAINLAKVQATEGRTPSQGWDRPSGAAQPVLYAVEPETDILPIEETHSAPDVLQPEAAAGLLLAGDNIFTDGFESGSFSAWSAAVTNTGRLSVTTAAATFGSLGMRALITSTTAMYVRDDTPNGETRYRARFYFHPNAISIPNTTAQNILVGRATTGSVEVFRIQFRKSGSNYQIGGQIRNDSTGYSSMTWYTISNDKHFIETDWKAATAAGANNGYLSLWIDGALKETKSSVDNDTRRVDEARLGPSSGIASGTSGTEYFDAFESRQSTYIGPVVLAGFDASPVQGVEPVTVTFTNTSQMTQTITAYLWNFGDGSPTSTITDPVHTYTATGYYTVSLTAWAGTDQDVLTRTRYITVTAVPPVAAFAATPVVGAAPLTVTFTNQSSPTQTITSYLWTFGDGTSGSTITDPVHAYTAMGYYTVALTAYAGAAQNTITKTRYMTVTPGVGQAIAISAKEEDEKMQALAYNPDQQEYLAVWHEVWGGVYARRVTGDGLPLGDSFTVNADGDRIQPAAAYGAGLYLVVWTDGSEVRGQRVLASGVLTGTSFQIASGDDNNVPAVDYNPASGEFLVTWHHNYVGNNSVRARRVSAAGTLLGEQIELTGSINDPSAAHDAAGNYLIVYMCDLWPEPQGICGWRMSSDGTLIGDRIQILSVATNLAAPAVAYNAQSDEYLVVARQNEDNQPEDVYARQVQSDGTVLGSAVALGAQTGQGDEFRPSVAYHPGANSYLVIWPDNRGGTWDVYGRLVDADGFPLQSSFALQTATGDQTNVALARQGAGQDLFLVYADTRNGNSDVYGQRYIPAAAIFTAAPHHGAAPLTVAFTNTSLLTTTITAYLWEFGDGYTDTLTNPLHTYDSSGHYTVTLTARTEEAQDTVTKTDYIVAGVEAGFTASPLEGFAPFTVTFTNTSRPTATITSYWWEFGDGTFGSTLTDPVHIYNSGGVFTVSLTALAAMDPDTLTRTHYISVTDDRPLSGDFLIAPGQGMDPRVAYNSVRDEYLIVWGGSSAPATAQRIAPSGRSISATIVLTSQASGQAAVAYDASRDQYLVVWPVADDIMNWHIEGQLVSGDGTPGRFISVAASSGTQNRLAVAYNALADAYLVVWEQDTASTAVLAQRVSGTGDLLGSAQNLTGSASGQVPDVAANPVTGDWLVAWLRLGVRARRIYSDGVAAADVLTVTLAQSSPDAPAVAVSSAGSYLVVWISDRNGVDETWEQRVSAAGDLLGDNLAIGAAVHRSYDVRPDLAYRPEANDFLVAWEDDRNEGWNLFGAYVSADGVVQGGDFAITQAAGDQFNPSLAYGGGSQIFLVAWVDTRSDEEGETYGRRWAPPTAGFNAAPAAGLAPLAVTFANVTTPTASVITFTWNLGDGATSDAISPTHTYTVPGSYGIVLTATQPDGLDIAYQPDAIQVNPAVGQAVALSAKETSEDQPALVYNPDQQEYLAVWHEQSDIYARRVISTGLPLDNSFAVFAGDGDQFQPAVAYGGGCYLVVWSKDWTEVWGQQMSALGAPMGSAFLIASGDENNAPAVDYNPASGEFLVTWHHNYVGNNWVRARRVSAAGELLGNQIDVSSGGDLEPAVAHDAAGNYLVVYACDRGQGFEICGQRLLGGGTLIGAMFKVMSVGTHLRSPDVAYDTFDDEYLVVARQDTGGSTEEVYARRVRSDGTVLDSAIALGAQTDDSFGPSVAYPSGTNTYLVAWSDNRNGNRDLYGQRVNVDGTLLGSLLALQVAPGDQTDVAISKVGVTGDLYLVYADTLSGNSDVYGERYAFPYASFRAAPTFGNAPLTVAFTDTSAALTNITGWEWSFGDGVTSTLQNPSHTYQLAGSYPAQMSIQTEVEAARSGRTSISVLSPPPPTTTVISYAYDGLYRLTRAAHSTGETFEYAYDAVGNRVTYTHTFSSQAVKTYTYDAANRLTSVDDQAYTWDNNGNLLNDGEKNYTYDQANRLINISANGLAWSAMYNGDGARLRQVTNGVPTTYTLDLDAGLVQVLALQDASGTTTYLYGITRIGEQQPGGWAYHLSDALGSVRQLADDAAQVTLARGYMPYGEELWSLGDGSSEYGYTGEDWDTTTQMVFLRARYMQPGVGRFLTQDLSRGDGTRPQTLNVYSYVAGNVVNLVDPSGYIGEPPVSPAEAWCSSNGWSGIPKTAYCIPAEDGAIVDIDGLYRWIAILGRVKFGWRVAADLLWHHLDGTGTSVTLDGQWLMQGPEDKKERDKLSSRFVDDYLKPAIDDCATFVNVSLTSDLVIPEVATDIGVAIGKHYINGAYEARILQNRDSASVVAKYNVQDRHDFDPNKGLVINQLGVGLVPHRWIISLEKAGYAKAFDISIAWTEWMYVRWK